MELNGGSPGNSEPVVLDNISQLDASNAAHDMTGKVVMTLVNMTEEASLRNSPAVRSNQGALTLQNPSIHLNLFVLFVANSAVYTDALARIAAIVKFFQRKPYFDPQNTVDTAGYMQGVNFKLIVELNSPTIEELNNLWGMLGGKQLPSVFYRIRMVELDSNAAIQRVPPIQNVQVQPTPPPL